VTKTLLGQFKVISRTGEREKKEEKRREEKRREEKRREEKRREEKETKVVVCELLCV